MPTNPKVVYSLSAEGNLDPKLVQLVETLNSRVVPAVEKSTGWLDRFNTAAKSLNQNAGISNLETMSALFIQFGGNVSRVASIVTSLIRPLAVIKELVGGVGAEALVAGGLVGGFGIALYATVSALEGVRDRAKEAHDELEKLGVNVNDEASKQIEAYAKSLDTLTIAYDKLKVEMGGGTGVSEMFAGWNQFKAELSQDVTNLLKQIDDATRGPGLNPYGAQHDQFGNPLEHHEGSLGPFADSADKFAELDRLGKQFTDTLGILGDHAKEDDRTLQDMVKHTDELNKKGLGLDSTKQKSMVGSPTQGSSQIYVPEIDRSVALVGTLIDNIQAQFKDVSATFSGTMEQFQAVVTKAINEASFKATSDNVVGALTDIGVKQSELTTLLTRFAGPLGSFVGTILDAVQQAPAVIGIVWDEIKSLFHELPMELGTVLRDTLPSIIEDLPAFIGDAILLQPQLFAAIIESLPALGASILKATVSAIPIWISQLKSMWVGFVSELRGEIARAGIKIVDALTKAVGDPFGIHLGPNARGHREFLGVHIPRHFKPFQENTPLPGISSHKLPVGGNQSRTSGGTGATLNVGSIHIHASDARKVAEQLRVSRGAYGYGLDIGKLAG